MFHHYNASKFYVSWHIFLKIEYMYIYEDYGSEELLSIVKKKVDLTYLSKIELKKELVKRNLGQEDVHTLQQEIDDETTKILNLEYLKNVGFDIERFSDNSFEITRSSKAILIDAASVFIGLLLLIAGIKGIMNFLSLSSEGGFHIMPIIFNFLLISIGITGFSLLYNGANRLIEFNGFKFLANNTVVRLFKRFDFELTETEAPASELSLEKSGDELILKLKDKEILKGNANSYRQEMTLKELIKKIKKQ